MVLAQDWVFEEINKAKYKRKKDALMGGIFFNN
jgi:hypothetical protein